MSKSKHGGAHSVFRRFRAGMISPGSSASKLHVTVLVGSTLTHYGSLTPFLAHVLQDAAFGVVAVAVSVAVVASSTENVTRQSS